MNPATLRSHLAVRNTAQLCGAELQQDRLRMYEAQVPTARPFKHLVHLRTFSALPANSANVYARRALTIARPTTNLWQCTEKTHNGNLGRNSTARNVVRQATSGLSAVRHDEDAKSATELPGHWAEHLKRLSSSVKRQQQSRWMAKIEAINKLEPKIQDLTNEELRGKTEEFKMRLETGRESLTNILPEAFAVVREASRRVLNLRHFDVQLIGGMALHEGRIAEINTGEGKTLVATLPAYLNALSGQGVHIITVNTYLAARDGHWMGGVFEALGLSVGVVTDHMPGPNNQAAFDADITYVTASHLGWLYLSDNSYADREEHLTIRRPFHFAIVDEADSVLIDDATQPLIISRQVPGQNNSKAWALATKVVQLADWENREEAPLLQSMDPAQVKSGIPARLWQKWGPWSVDESGALQGEILIDVSNKQLVITAAGCTQIIHQLVRLGHKFPEADREGRQPIAGDLWIGERPLGQFINLAFRACLLTRGKDYLVRNGRVVILNQNTGRSIDNSRWSDGLHQAIEAKEGLEPRGLDVTYASITYQLLFSLYPNMGGMTGTAESAEDEFLEMYQRSVEVIPPHTPSKRVDHPVEVYIDPFSLATASKPSAKQNRVLRLVYDSLQKGQPVLLGTHSVKESEEWAALLASRLLACQVLNATPSAVEKEAEIIAQAGMPRTAPYGEPCITIATSMAGRGTDIRLGGDAKGLMQMALRSLLLPLMIDMRADEDGWKRSKEETCPLEFWPNDAFRNLQQIAPHLPEHTLACIKTAAGAITGAFFEQSAKITFQEARTWLTACFELAENVEPSFLFTARRDMGDLERVPSPQLFEALQNFCDENLPVHSFAADEQEGARSRVARAAVWLWLWLDIVYCPRLAAEARAAGGLRVMCTSLAPTWRVWDQLKGRSGRQGDPGETFVLLSWDADLSLDPVLREKFPKLLEFCSSEAEPVPLPHSLASRVILRPAMTRREGNARDSRSQTKKSDEVLHTVRQQLYSFRRWLLKANAGELRGLIRMYCFEVAARLVRQHVDPRQPPSHSASWNIQQLMADVWQLVDGADAASQRGEQQDLQMEYPLQGLFGIAMPQVGILHVESLAAAAEQLRAYLTDSSQPKPPPIALNDVDSAAIQADMLKTQTAFLASSEGRYGGFQGRHADKAMQLLEYMASVIYSAWLGPKRAQLKLILQLSVPRGVLIYDSLVQPFPEASARERPVVDLQETVQWWERKALAESLTELWVGLLADSSKSWQAATMTSLSRLTPLQEYTSAMSRRFVQLLDDHRVLGLQSLFAGPDPADMFREQVQSVSDQRRQPQPGSSEHVQGHPAEDDDDSSSDRKSIKEVLSF